MSKLKIAFFDAKEYDRQSFEASNANGEFDIRFLETRLTPDTYKLAEGCDVVCSMPNVIVTSHQAFLTNEALSNIADTTLNNIREFFNSDCCTNEVCYKCGKITDCKQLHDKKCF